MKTLIKNHALKALSIAVTAALLPASAQSQMLEEVVVTAQKRAQNMNDVSVAITAFTGDQMKELGIGNATDMALHTPGLLVTETQPAGIPVYTIRGVGFEDFAVGSSGTVGVYVDEVALPYPAMTRGVAFDVERIEVLKGPQGDLYGRNNTGGAINFVSRKPSEEFEAGLNLDVGSYEYAKFDGFVGGSLGDTFNGRFALTTTQQSEGWQRSVTTGEKHGEIDEFGGRILLDWAASDTVNVLFNVHASRDQSDNQAPFAVGLTNAAYPIVEVPDLAATGNPNLYEPLLVALTGDPSFLTQTTTLPADVSQFVPASEDARAADWSIKPTRDNEAFGASLTVNWDMSDSYSLTSITAYEDFERKETHDYDGTALALWDSRVNSTIDGWSQELRVNFTGDNLNWIGGLYLSSDTVDEDLEGFVGSSGFAGGGLGFNDFAILYSQDTDTAGIFGHMEWQFADQFRMIAGLRYTNEEREWTGCTHDLNGGIAVLYSGVFGLTDQNGAAFQQGDCLTIDGTSVDFVTDFAVDDPGPFIDKITTENVSGKIGIDYLPNDDWLIYGSVSTGFKSGGYNGAPVNDRAQLLPYSEEELLAYELGFKASLLDQSMQINAAAFLYDYSDKQAYDVVETFFGPLTNLVNIPESTIQGAELELQWIPATGLDVRLGASFLDTEIDRYTDFYGEDQAGKSLAQAPELQLNGLLSYQFDLSDAMRMRFVTDFNYSDSYHTLISSAGGTVNYNEMQIDSWFVVNGRLAVQAQDGRWEVALWGRNLTDEFYQPSLMWTNDVIFSMAGKSRTYGLSVSYNWF